MQEKSFAIAEIGFIAVTRVALGIGIGLLISGRLTRVQRYRVGRTLLGIGVATTIPIIVNAVRKRPAAQSAVTEYDVLEFAER